MLALAHATARARPDPRLQAAVRAAPGGEEVCPIRPRLRRRRRCAPSWRRGSASRSPSCASPTTSTAWEKARRPPRRWTLALRYAAWATHTPQGQRAAQGRHRCSSVPHKARPAPSRSGRDRSWRDGVTMLRLPRAHRRRARRLRADRSRHRSRRRARSGQLLHLVPQAGQGFLLARACKDRKSGEFKKSPFGVTLAGCPLDEKISRDEPGRGAAATRIGALAHRRDRQPDVRGDRPPHLQRLHEGLHLPEAGAGRHSAGRDPHR